MTEQASLVNTAKQGLDINWKAGRRAFLASVGLATLGFATYSQTQESKAAITDADILNFALNLEYLEAEFYLRAAFGRGLANTDSTGRGALGPTTGGSAVPFQSNDVRNYAKEIASDEEAHVKFIRSALGGAAVAKPAINLFNSFTAAARAAGIIKSNETFNAFANENHFLIAAFIFEDVGVTAYKGAASLISDKGILDAAAGILAVEAYHAGIIRTTLYAKGMGDGPRGLLMQAQKISDLRDAADGGLDNDQGIGTSANSNLVPTDPNGIAFSRTPVQVLKVAYLGGTGRGGFYPAGLNGTIK